MAFCVAERTILPDEIAEAKGEEKGQQEYWLLTVTPDEYVQLRDAYFMENGYIRWDKDAITYALLENDYADGYAYKVQHHGREDLLLLREEENIRAGFAGGIKASSDKSSGQSQKIFGGS